MDLDTLINTCAKIKVNASVIEARVRLAMVVPNDLVDELVESVRLYNSELHNRGVSNIE